MNIISKSVFIFSLIFLISACKRREDIKISKIAQEEKKLKLEKVQDCYKSHCQFIFRDQQEKIVKTNISDLENLINILLKNDHKFIFTIYNITSDEGEQSTCITKIYNDKGILKEDYIPAQGDVYWNYRCDVFEYSQSELSDFDLAIKDLKKKVEPVVDQFKIMIDHGKESLNKILSP